jgi:DNA primase
MAAECVFVCEGEKDVDNLRGLGLTATCNSGGAGKWKPEYAEYLKGKSVIILPDNDSPGQQHGQEVARSLCGIAKSVKLVDLPGLPEKGDASDWIAARHKEGKNNDVIRDELLNLVDSAAEYRPIGESIETVYEAIDIEPAITPALNLDSVTVSTVFLIKK